MENKVMDKSQERILNESEEYAQSLSEDIWLINYAIPMRRGYIAGATKEAQRNKEDAIGFLKWYRNYERTVLTKFAGEEQLYKIYINQKV